MGHGKFAAKVAPGLRETSFDSYMLLNENAEPMFDKMLDVKGKAQAKLVGLSPMTRDNAYVQEATVLDDAGEAHNVQVVRAYKASLQQYMDYYNVTLMNPKVLCGMFAGVMLVFVFCALTMQAVGRAAYKMMLECRLQFGKVAAYLVATKGMSEADSRNAENWPRGQVTHNGEKIPDYARCVDISTRGAQREMIFPSMLAIAVPIAVGLVFDVAGVMGLLAGGLTSGFAVAIFMANAGGAWDNAKKYVEKGNYGGKGSEAHKATVVGDTVGDPFKDTSGPSLNILIKLMSMVSVVFAGLIVAWGPKIGAMLGM
jgi:Na+/H+-translocating membrane pyrophosphatase